MKNDVTPSYQPVMLLRNVTYPTFQLYCLAGKGKSSDQVLTIVVLETYKWLRQRFRDFELPPELNWPDPELWDTVDSNDFRSFRIDVGYILEVVWLPTEKIWTLQLTEPDMGAQPGASNQARSPVPGRLFETNIAYRIVKNQVECGFCTNVSEPFGTTTECEVFRLAVIKYIARNPQVGLWHNYQLTDNYQILDSIENIKILQKWIKSNERMLPIVLIAEHRKKQKTSSIPDGEKETACYSECTSWNVGEHISVPFNDKIIPPHINILDRLTEKSMFSSDPFARYGAIDIASTKDLKDNDIRQDMEGLLQFDLSDLTRYRMGYAQFFVLPVRYIDDFNMQTESLIEEGNVIIFEPKTFGGEVLNYEYRYIKRDVEAFCNQLDQFIQCYPKKKPMNFGNILFLLDAKAMERDKLLSTIRSKEEMLIYAEGKQQDIETRHKKDLSILQGICEDKEKKLSRSNMERDKAEEKAKELKEFNENQKKQYEQKIAAKDDEINRLYKLQLRPSHPKEIAGWVESQFADRLIFHKRAQELMNEVAPNTIDLKILCDALEYLATDYLDELIGSLSEDERNINCQRKYGRPFYVTPIKGISPNMYPSEYKIRGNLLKALWICISNTVIAEIR